MAPLKAKPAHIFFDGIDKFDVFLDRVGVIKTQCAATLVVVGNAKIEPDGLSMANMQITVGFRRKTGDNGVMLFSRQVVIDDLADKIDGFGMIGHSLAIIRVFCQKSLKIEFRFRSYC